MTVFVDPLRAWGWVLRGREVRSCHMFTDSVDLEPLHAMAERIGMKRAWFQSFPEPHYDVTERRRPAAIEAGAVQVDFRTAVAVFRSRRAAVAKAA